MRTGDAVGELPERTRTRVRAEQHDDGRAHVEAADLGAARDGTRLRLRASRARRPLAISPRANVLTLDTFSAPTKHHDHRARGRSRTSRRRARCGRTAVDRRRGRAAHAETRARNVARASERAAERRVHAVIVVRREIDREVTAALERRDGCAGLAEQLGKRVAAAFGLQQPIAARSCRARVSDAVGGCDDRRAVAARSAARPLSARA